MASKANKVLVVDDSLVINKILTESITTDLHLDVVSVFDMTGAIKAISDHPDQFFVAILDLNLPDAPDGQIVQAMVTLGIRPIILTATLSDDLHDEMMSKPIIDYVIKRNLSEMQYVIDLVQRLYENYERHILIVDDSRLSRKLLRSLLERHNFSVTEATTPEQGLSILASAKQRFDLIVVDYNMPSMPGYEFIAKVRSEHSRHELAIIGISAVGSGTVSVQMLKSGANDFISRPFMHEEFYCRVNQNIDAINSYRRLQEQAFNDQLTGLYNRRYLSETGNSLFENAKRNNLTMGVAVADIDNFARVNEQFGHNVGDHAIKHVSSLMCKHFREGDTVARIGGEVFCLIFLNVDEGSAPDVLERLRSCIESIPLVVDNQRIPLTVSIGYTLALGESFEAMVKRAEELLGTAKATGKNRVQG